jgi:hypothetical protein
MQRTHGVGDVRRQNDEQRDIEYELGQEDRPQQSMTEDEHHTLPNGAGGMRLRDFFARGLDDADQQHRRTGGERRRDAKRRRAADPAGQRPAERRTGGIGGGAGEFDSTIGERQDVALDEGGDERGRGDAIADRAACPDESQDCQQRQAQSAEAQQHQHADERDDTQRLGCRHQPRPRHAIREHAGRNRQQQERQGLRRLQDAGLGLPRSQGKDGDDRRRGQADLLGRLRRKVGPREPLEGGRQISGGFRIHADQDGG